MVDTRTTSSIDGTTNREPDFNFLWDDFKQEIDYPTVRPMLAHYCTVQTAEKILRSREVWLANPLLMNDVEELRFGLLRAKDAFVAHEALRAACRPDQWAELAKQFEQIFDEFSDRDALDVFVFCMSEYEDEDGLLSMWRGYGGNGKGAALVFDTSKLNPVAASPLMLARVQYRSTEDRIAWINSRMDRFAQMLREHNPPIDALHTWTKALFLRLLQGALFSKHSGFREEKEWRLAYCPQWAVNAPTTMKRHFLVTKRGVEPKLVVGEGVLAAEIGGGVKFDELLNLILLGPGMSGGFEQRAFSAMLRQMRTGLAEKVSTSSTPYRSID